MPKEINAIIITGSVVGNMNKPATEKTFGEYKKISRKSRQSVLPYIQSQLSRAKHLDVIWDEYIANSLKAATESKRGQGARRAYSLPVKYHATGSSSCETSKNCSSFSFNVRYPYMKKNKSSKLKARISCVVLRVTTP